MPVWQWHRTKCGISHVPNVDSGMTGEVGNMTCRPGSHRCAALALWFLDNSLSRKIAADCERNMKEMKHEQD